MVEAEQADGIQPLEFHQGLVEVGGSPLSLSRHRLVPHLGHRGQVVVVLAEVVVEPVTLVAVPLMAEGVVVGVAEHADALVVHQFGVRLGCLPLGGLLPDGLAVAALQVEAGIVGLRVAVIAVLGVAHIVERVAHLVGDGMADGLAGRGAEPEGTDLEVVAAAVAHPLSGMVQQHHHLIFCDVRLHGIHEAQLVDLEFIERLALLQQVLLVHLVGAGRL